MEIHIDSGNDIVESRTECKKIAKKIGFGMVDQTKIATAVSELTRNVIDHAEEGDLTVKSLDKDGKTGIEIKLQDWGPGIEDVEQAMQEGHSTQDTMGQGLPGTKKLMDEMEIDSEPGEGTKVVVRKWL